MQFNGLFVGPNTLPLLSSAVTRSISAENPRGEKGKGAQATQGTGLGCARELGRGWKIAPSVSIEPGQDYVLADIDGPGTIQSIWLTGAVSRDFIIRMYWDGQTTPSVECPMPDFFGCGWFDNRRKGYAFSPLNSLMVCVNPKGIRLLAAKLFDGVRQPQPWPQLLLADAVPQALPDYA